MNKTLPFSILVVDDEQEILDSYRKIFDKQSSKAANSDRLKELEERLSLNSATPPDREEQRLSLRVCYCRQGDEAIEKTRVATLEKRPFSIAFIDVRMPPGPDGISTAQQIRVLDPFVNIVIVTAFSDISPDKIAQQILPPEHLLYIQKPFHSHEIKQFTTALTAKWQAEKKLRDHNEALDQLVKEKTTELNLTVGALEKSNHKYRIINESLLVAEKRLEAKADDLTGANTALQRLTKQHETDQKELEKKVLFAIHEMVDPYIDTLGKSGLNETQTSFLKIIQSNLNEIITPFMKGLSHKYFRLSPAEIQLANLIKQGKTTKEIGDLLNLTKRNVEFHRDRIREKIGIKNTKANLKNVLKEMEIEFL